MANKGVFERTVKFRHNQSAAGRAKRRPVAELDPITL